MSLRLISSIAIGLFSVTALAAPESYTIDPNHTFPSFEVNHLGFSTQRGRFDSTTGHIMLDPRAKRASAEITIETGSIDTGLDKLEAHLRKADFFDVNKYPTITFKANKAHFSGATLTGLDGKLTMHGQTRPISLQVHNFKCGNNPINKKALCSADVTGTLKRSDFGIKYGVPLIGDEVKLLIQVEAYKDV